MKLRYSPTSPYVRKVTIAAIETGLDGRIERILTNAWAPDTDLPRDNPLCKVPALVTDGGEVLFDSPVICEYLDSLHGGRKLFPQAGGERWRQLRLAALADGVLDAAVARLVEVLRRPEDKRWADWVSRQERAVLRALDVLEAECAAWGDDFLIGQIGVAAALGYVDFRWADSHWRDSRPQLAAWWGKAQGRPSVSSTIPKDPA